MIKAIIVDDESAARDHLKMLLAMNCPEINVVGEAYSVTSGKTIIEKHEPDLVLLDINLTDGTGFDLLKLFPKVNFGVIFVTAFSEFAVQAFKFSAIYYLLKPIEPDELISAVKKAADELNRHNYETRLKSLYYNLQNNPNKSKKMVLSSNSNMHVVNSEEIILCSSERNYTEFFLADGRKITVAKTIKDYDELLADYGFFRVHKQYLININHIKSFDKSGTGILYMSNNFSIPVSTRKKEQLLEMFVNF